MHDVPYFDRFAPLYDRLLPSTDAAPIESGLALADRPVERLLDVGGGTGRVGGAVEPTPIVFDASRPMLAEAREKGFPTVQGDARSLPIRTESVDAAVSVDAVHHLPALETVLGEVARVLRPGGVLVVRDFDPTTLRGRGLAAAEHLVGFDSTFHSAEAIGDTMAAAGFEVTILESGFTYTVAGKRTEDTRVEY